MTEQQLTDRMHAAVLDEPPLGFDPDEVADLARRRQRQRRLAFTSVGVTGAVLAVVATIVVGVPGDREETADPVPDLPTCGDLAPDGGEPLAVPDLRQSADRLNRTVPGVVERHLGVEVRTVLDGMRPVGCEPALLASYEVVGQDWTVSVRLSRRHDVLTPTDDSYQRQLGGAWKRAFVIDERWVDGSRVRVYGTQLFDEDHSKEPPVTARPPEIDAATRLDPDGLVVEVTVNGTDDMGLVTPLRNLVSDRDLRFRPGG